MRVDCRSRVPGHRADDVCAEWRVSARRCYFGGGEEMPGRCWARSSCGDEVSHLHGTAARCERRFFLASPHSDLVLRIFPLTAWLLSVILFSRIARSMLPGRYAIFAVTLTSLLATPVGPGHSCWGWLEYLGVFCPMFLRTVSALITFRSSSLYSFCLDYWPSGKRRDVERHVCSCFPSSIHLGLSALRLCPFDTRLILYAAPGVAIVIVLGLEELLRLLKCRLFTGKSTAATGTNTWRSHPCWCQNMGPVRTSRCGRGNVHRWFPGGAWHRSPLDISSERFQRVPFRPSHSETWKRLSL